jgi:hypothetical protein
MNRPLYIILLLAAIAIWGCDTVNNVKPRNEDFFIKMYAGIKPGDQMGIDLIETSDGGFLIAGTSDSLGSKEIILVKTDSKGNEEWTYGASLDIGANINSTAKSVIELADGYLVGGIIEGTINKSVLLKTDFSGNFSNYVTISTDSLPITYYNELSKITLGHSGILVSGETGLPRAAGLKRNGFISLYNEDLSPNPIGNDTIKIFGLQDDDFVTGAYEVEDTATISKNNGTRFLAFGNSIDLTTQERTFYYVNFNGGFDIINDIGDTRIPGGGTQISNYVTRRGDVYWMVGETDQPGPQMFMVGWQYSQVLSDWNPVGGSPEVGNSQNVSGKGIAIQSSGNYVLVGDFIINPNVHTEIHLSKVDNFRSIRDPWPKTFGTNTSTYSAGAVITLQDGSIVLVGTADLEPVKKIVLIKTGPDGQMSF